MKESLVTAARLGDIMTVRELLNLDVVREFIPNLDPKDEEALVKLIRVKLNNIEAFREHGLLFVPSGSFLEKNPTATGLFSMTLIPETEVTMHLMINPSAVRRWNPAWDPECLYPIHLICSLPDAPTEPVKCLLECHNADVNQATVSCYTPLVFAIVRGNLPLVKFLVERGALLNLSPLIYITTEELESYYSYIKVFSPENVTFPQIYYYFTPLEAAGLAYREDILCYLLSKGANDNPNRGLWNVLFYPVVSEQRKIVERLLESGVDINGKDLLGTTPLHKAAQRGCIDLAYILMKNSANINAVDNYGWTPLHVACLFSKKATLEMIQLLLDGGADINARTRFGFTPLHLAEAGNDFSFLQYLVENIEIMTSETKHNCQPEVHSTFEHGKIINLLVENGASCNSQDDILGWTALHWAAASGDLHTAEILVSKGARVSIKSRYKFNAYQTALCFIRGPVSTFLMTASDEPANAN
ncbi:Putative Ankyrin-2 [Halyomorpha halys]|nr:Putative Ankyrin-2 [Halyomorpha halys]